MNPWRLRVNVMLCAALTPATLRGQAPLNHIPFCASDSFASAFLTQVRFRVAGTDSTSRVEQARVGLAPRSADEVSVVVDDAVCVAASGAYARASPAARGIPPPFPVAVVRAGDRYLVQLPALPGGDPSRAEVVVFDLAFGRLGSYRAAD